MAELGCGRRHTPLNILEAAAVTDSRTTWTAARCNRLLRPLSSKIALLRKERQSDNQQHERKSSDSGRGLFGKAGSNPPRNTERAGQQTWPACKPATGRDEEWESSPRPRKKIRRTYSSKTKTSLSRHDHDKNMELQPDRCLTSAVIELPPHLAHEAKPSESLTPDLDSRQASCPTQLGSCLPDDLPRSLAPVSWKLVDGICKQFVALLKATSYRKPMRPVGCPSLLSTCLRQIPRYITEEELLLKADDLDNYVDVSTTVYNQLEEFGSVPGDGWKLLRLPVRAHGTKMITDAIKEGLLDLPIARHLFFTCLEFHAHDEAQCIIQSLITLAEHAKAPSSRSDKPLPYNTHSIITSLDKLAHICGMNGFLYRHTAAMLNSDILSVDWISSNPMIRTWNAVIRSIAQGDGDAQSAVVLLQSAIAASCRTLTAMPHQSVDDIRLRIHTANRRPTLRSSGNDQAIENIADTQLNTTTNGRRPCIEPESEISSSSTLSTVFSVLAAIARLQASVSSETEYVSSTGLLTILQTMALEATKANELSSQGIIPRRSVEPYADSLCLPLLAAGLAEIPPIESCNHNCWQTIPSLSSLAELSNSTKIFTGAGSFVCAVARYSALARSEDIFNVTKAIVRELIMVSKSTCATKPIQQLCSDLALAAAFTYAEDTSRPTHLDWAMQVELDVTGKGAGTPKPAAVRTPARSIRQSKIPYRWEEGICEWIVKTPDLLLQKPREIPINSDHAGEAIPTPSIHVKERQPLCSPNSSLEPKSALNLGRKGGKVEALQVLIHIGKDHGRTGASAHRTRSIDSQPSKKRLGPKVTQNIYQDIEIDELSTPESSQGKSSAPPALRELPNAPVGAKRKRKSKRQQKMKALDDPRLTQYKLPAEGSGEDLEAAADIDELALHFKW